jgi:hypothetical protein
MSGRRDLRGQHPAAPQAGWMARSCNRPCGKCLQLVFCQPFRSGGKPALVLLNHFLYVIAGLAAWTARHDRLGLITALQEGSRSPEIRESADVYGRLVGSRDLDCLHYRGVPVSITFRFPLINYVPVSIN